MGPVALFDKSFLQSLSLDEAVWFDHFFIGAIAPLFFIETLADLEKAAREGRTPESEVSAIAEKTPVLGGAPCASHVQLGLNELLGRRVSMKGQIHVAGGQFVKAAGKTGVVFKGLPEAEAFARWQDHEFVRVEREFAREWRVALASINLAAIASGLRAVGVDATTCRSLPEARHQARRAVEERDRPFDRIKLAISFLDVPHELHERVIERWIGAGKPSLAEYVPYTAHMLTVEVFFHVALASHLIGTERQSNRVDMAYLFYVPHCDLFVSGDRLHQRCAPLFLRPDQQFIWAQDMKRDLKRINDHFMMLPDCVKYRGINSFAKMPPDLEGSLVAKLWVRRFPDYRRNRPMESEKPLHSEDLLKAEISQMTARDCGANRSLMLFPAVRPGALHDRTLPGHEPPVSLAPKISWNRSFAAVMYPVALELRLRECGRDRRPALLTQP